ncbi:DUF6063 family protein [Methanosarcina sp. 2.H.A.1B.4]|uniref:DUF6063 family protein n=1 Tax=Methanosarcina sp. 2.H.A.1B.4 TaxID=1483600 RepID=UPI0006220A03|nr:DUF6063 family protein [Methanosarcina sp. 2.H.A.1B.4]KKG07772.1 hypothetical protein EO92_04255 [Methanosarcina sp. 2.H.A.1B.4]
MTFEKKSMEIAFEMLTEILRKNGVYSLDLSKKSWCLNPEQESEIMEAFEFIIKQMGLIMCVRNKVIYLSPGVDNPVYGMTLEEIKVQLSQSFTNLHVYTAFFIIHVIITEFYKESMPETQRAFILKSDLINAINTKVDALSTHTELDKLSEEHNYNFSEIRDLWKELPVIMHRKGRDDPIETGKSSRYALVNTTLKFLEAQDLVHVQEDMIRLTERFKAIIDNAYRNEQVQYGIAQVIESLTSTEVDEYANN